MWFSVLSLDLSVDPQEEVDESPSEQDAEVVDSRNTDDLLKPHPSLAVLIWDEGIAGQGDGETNYRGEDAYPTRDLVPEVKQEDLREGEQPEEPKDKHWPKGGAA